MLSVSRAQVRARWSGRSNRSLRCSICRRRPPHPPCMQAASLTDKQRNTCTRKRITFTQMSPNWNPSPPPPNPAIRPTDRPPRVRTPRGEGRGGIRHNDLDRGRIQRARARSHTPVVGYTCSSPSSSSSKEEEGTSYLGVRAVLCPGRAWRSETSASPAPWITPLPPSWHSAPAFLPLLYLFSFSRLLVLFFFLSSKDPHRLRVHTDLNLSTCVYLSLPPCARVCGETAPSRQSRRWMILRNWNLSHNILLILFLSPPITHTRISQT